MAEEKSRGALKRFFTRGLAALLPTVITIMLLIFCFEYLNDTVGIPLGKGVLWLIEKAGGQSANDLAVSAFEKDLAALRQTKLATTLVGFPLAIVIVFVAGFFLTSFIGRRLFLSMENRVLARFPVIKVVYPYAKQFTDFFFGEEHKVSFRGVVAVQYPRPGLYSMGFVTSNGLRSIDEKTNKHHVTVFIPTSPTPATGFIVLVPADEVVPLPVSVEEAVRFVLSGGVVVPSHQLPAAGEPAKPPQLPPG
ncbi:MAG: DUF502 domain-containing protein [Planctomycetota bacterium]|nr:DUF502 domain-containing protein [Planctomycetota bacterium]